jgi:hypothetical protein
VYIPADGRLIEMAQQVTDEVNLLPPPLVIVTDPAEPRAIRILSADTDERVPFETLGSAAEQGAAFDTSGRSADATLIACARLFIEREGLTATDPESLAIAASETPQLRDQLLALRDQL